MAVTIASILDTAISKVSLALPTVSVHKNFSKPIESEPTLPVIVVFVKSEGLVDSDPTESMRRLNIAFEIRINGIDPYEATESYHDAINEALMDDTDLDGLIESITFNQSNFAVSTLEATKVFSIREVEYTIDYIRI